MGQNLQGQSQKELEATRLNQQQSAYAPYQQMSYYGDVLNRTPSGQTSTTQTSAPSASPLSQVAGLGVTGLAAYNAFK
jgi:hypothetical protein